MSPAVGRKHIEPIILRHFGIYFLPTAGDIKRYHRTQNRNSSLELRGPEGGKRSKTEFNVKKFLIMNGTLMING